MAADTADTGGYEEALMRRLPRDPVALDELDRLYRQRIYRFVRPHCGRDTEDVVQVVFLKVWLNAERFQSMIGTVKPWIYTIARNEVVNYLRRNGRVLQDCDTALNQAPAPNTDPDRTLIHSERLSVVKQCLKELQQAGRLSATQDNYLQLLYFEDMRLSQIALTFGVTAAAVRSTVDRAIRYLTDCVGRKGALSR
jgi:RNA polymerase sigma factor (sigma-70 family)